MWWIGMGGAGASAGVPVGGGGGGGDHAGLEDGLVDARVEGDDEEEGDEEGAHRRVDDVPVLSHVATLSGARARASTHPSCPWVCSRRASGPDSRWPLGETRAPGGRRE